MRVVCEAIEQRQPRWGGVLMGYAFLMKEPIEWGVCGLGAKRIAKVHVNGLVSLGFLVGFCW